MLRKLPLKNGAYSECTVTKLSRAPTENEQTNENIASLINLNKYNEENYNDHTEY